MKRLQMLFFVIAMAMLFVSCGYNYDNNVVYIQDDITKIDINWFSGNVIIEPVEDDWIIIAEDVYDNDCNMGYKVSGKNLSIVFSDEEAPAVDKDLHVRIPADWAEKITLNIESYASFDKINIQDLSFKSITVSNSGTTRISNVISQTLKVDAPHGETIVTGEFENIDLSAASGNITASLYGDNIKKCNIYSAHGKVIVFADPTEEPRYIYITSAHGEIRAEGETFYSEYESGTKKGAKSVIKIGAASSDISFKTITK